MWVALSKEGNSQRSKFLYFDSFFRDCAVTVPAFAIAVPLCRYPSGRVLRCAGAGLCRAHHSGNGLRQRAGSQ